MLYCPHCGAALHEENTTEEEKIIVDDPEVMDGYHPGQFGEYQSVYEDNQTLSYDRLSLIWCILVFLFPVVGIVLYFFNRNNHHNKAATALKTAGISILINFVSLLFMH